MLLFEYNDVAVLIENSDASRVMHNLENGHGWLGTGNRRRRRDDMNNDITRLKQNHTLFQQSDVSVSPQCNSVGNRMGIIESLCVVHGCATHYYSKEGRGHIAGMSVQNTSMNKHDVKLMISLQFDIHERENYR